MNDIAPRQYYVETPLSGGARFIRGFKRLGIVFGTLALLIGLGISLVTANNGRLDALKAHTQAFCFLDAQHAGQVVMNQYRKAEVDLAATGCAGPIYSEPPQAILDLASRAPTLLEGFIEPMYLGSLASVATSLTIFAIFWLIGWLCAGFTRD